MHQMAGEFQNLKKEAAGEAQNLKKELAVLQKECDLLTGSLAECKVTLHMVEGDPFMKRQLASRDSLKGSMWCQLSHVTLQI